MRNLPGWFTVLFPSKNQICQLKSISWFQTRQFSYICISKLFYLGLGNGSLATPPPLRTPNAVTTPTSDTVTDVAAAAASAQVWGNLLSVSIVFFCD